MFPDLSSSDRAKWLIAIAAPKEFQAALDSFGIAEGLPMLWEAVSVHHRIDAIYTGVGKSNAAGAVAHALASNSYLGVLSVGIAGVLPGSGCAIGDVVCASSSVFADEGVRSADGFFSCAQMGFAPFDQGGDSLEHGAQVLGLLGPMSDCVGPVACVSACSGTDELANDRALRTGAIAEAMEGASVALAAYRTDSSILTGELRVISNTTGRREAQQWDLEGALDKLGVVFGRLGQVLH